LAWQARCIVDCHGSIRWRVESALKLRPAAN
jgi:hypothetical protein